MAKPSLESAVTHGKARTGRGLHLRFSEQLIANRTLALLRVLFLKALIKPGASSSVAMWVDEMYNYAAGSLPRLF